jgi:threonine synthase
MRHYVTGLQCRDCGHLHEPGTQAGCARCFAPLEVAYDYDAIRQDVKRDTIDSRPATMWRWQELLPLTQPPRVGLATGGTPLLPAPRLAERLGVRELYLKDDAVNHPTLSFKDRVTAVAINKAVEFGFKAVGCASTGNLANSVAAQAARAGLPAYVFVPADLETAKVVGTLVYGARLVRVNGSYDQINRLCTMIADAYPWGLVNVNLRPWYGEGSKTFGYEIAHALGWRAPDAVVVPMAGGSLITRIYKGLGELRRLGWIDERPTRMFGAQAAGCNPIAAAVQDGRRDIVPVKPNTIARSLAIGNPADGYFATGVIGESGGWAEAVSDDEIRAGIRLLAETEGLFTETAGGVTVASALRLAAAGRLPKDGVVVLALTGNGLKTQDAVVCETPAAIEPKLDDFEALVESLTAAGTDKGCVLSVGHG